MGTGNRRGSDWKIYTAAKILISLGLILVAACWLLVFLVVFHVLVS